MPDGEAVAAARGQTEALEKDQARKRTDSIPGGIPGQVVDEAADMTFRVNAGAAYGTAVALECGRLQRTNYAEAVRLGAAKNRTAQAGE
jgi:hypothetical protein